MTSVQEFVKRRLFFPLLLLLALIFAVTLPQAAAADDSANGTGLGEVTVSVPLLQAGELPAEDADTITDPRLTNAQNAILACLSNMSERISLQSFSLTQTELKTLFSTILNGTPELFYVSNTYKITVSAGYIVNFTPAYHYTAEEVASMRVIYEEKIREIVNLVPASGSDLDKLLFLNDYFAVNYEYDNSLTVYDAYRFFTEKTGVCQSYTLSAIAVLDRLGIPVTFAQSAEMNHIWNLVSVGGNWYHLDFTWNDPVANQFGRAIHQNFLLSDEGIRRTGHSGWTTPDNIQCTDTTYDNYFWQTVKTPFVRLDGVTYYAENGVIRSVDLSTQKTTVLLTVTDNWPAAGKPGYYYSTRYVCLAAYDGCLFYNTPGSIHRYRVKTGENESFYTPGAGGSIFSMYQTGNSLRYLISGTNDFNAYITIGTVVLTGSAADNASVLMTGSTGVTALYPSVQTALAAMNDPDVSYLLEPYLPTGSFLLPGGVLPQVSSVSFRGNGSTALVLRGAVTLSYPLRATGVIMHGEAGASLSLGTHSLSYAATAPVLDFPVTGGVGSSLILFSTGSGSGVISDSVRCETLAVGGSFRLTAPLTADVLHIVSDSSLTLENAVSCDRITGTARLTMIPVYNPETDNVSCLSLKADSEAPLTVLYGLQLKSRSVLSAPGMEPSRLSVVLSGASYPEDITLLFARDAEGNFRRIHDSAFHISPEGVLLTYVSCFGETLAVVPNSVTAIGDYAFAYAPEPEEVFLPEGIQSVGMFGFGYVYMADGSLSLSTKTVYQTEQHSVCENYAEEKGIRSTPYFRAESGGFSVLCYPTRGDLSVVSHIATDEIIVLPSRFDIGGIRYDDILYDKDIFAGQSGYTIFCPVLREELPFAGEWSDTNTLYCKNEWFTVSFYASGVLFYSYPSPADETVRLPDTLPQKEGSVQYSYPFTRWDGFSDGMTVTAALRFSAVFTETVNRYTYTFYDEDGKTVLAQGMLDYGSVILPPENPVKAPAGEQVYVFTGWSGFTDGLTLTQDLTFTAKYRALSHVPTEIESAVYKIEVAYAFVRKIGQMTNGAIFLSNFNDSEFLSLSSGKTPVPSGSYVATGMQLTLALNGTTLQTMTTVVTGDLNGDGKITLTDFLQMKAHLLGKNVLSGASFAAADLNGDRAVSITDLLLLKAYLLGKGVVVPQ